MAVLQFVDNLSPVINNGIFLDLGNHFDIVDHRILLCKLSHYSVGRIALNRFKDYLSIKKACFVLYDVKSILCNICCWIPQGSVFRPLLFILYINGITYGTEHFLYALFADNTSNFYAKDCINNQNYIVIPELTSLNSWFKAYRLSFEIYKTNFIWFNPYKHVSIG